MALNTLTHAHTQTNRSIQTDRNCELHNTVHRSLTRVLSDPKVGGGEPPAKKSKTNKTLLNYKLDIHNQLAWM